MDDNVSIKSSDSVTTSGEYEIVPETPQSEIIQTSTKDVVDSGGVVSPTLNIANNGDMKELEKNLNELIHEMDGSSSTRTAKLIAESNAQPIQTQTATKINLNDVMPEISASTSTTPIATVPPKNLHLSANFDIPSNLSTPDIRVGQSIFYDCTELSSTTATGEKQDDMKPERSDTDEEMSDIDQDGTVFSGVTYLGAVNVNAPKSDTEIHRNMTELNSIPEAVGLKVSVSIPSCLDGLVVLHDAVTNAVVRHFEVHRILFYARGAQGTPDQACFAFTWSHGDSQESVVFQCHVFRCHIPEAVTQVSTCFAKAFQRVPQSMTGSITSSAPESNVMVASITSDITGNPISSAEYEFIVSLEIREKVAKNAYAAVPRDRSCFRLRTNVDKEVCITVKQTPSDKFASLFIDRCFGVLLSPGKLVRQADMHLLDMVSMGYVTKGETGSVQHNSSPYQIIAEGRASDKAFGQLNTDSKYITVAVDLVIKGIQEPVRFIIETSVTITSGSEIRFMDHFINKRSMTQRFYLQLKDNGEGTWEVNSIDPSEEIVETASHTTPSSSSILKLGINNLSKMVRSASVISLGDDDSPTDYSSDGDEPLLSGTGDVSKDCPQESLDEWGPILQEWLETKRPKNLLALVRIGIPEALRGKVWQKLANVENNTEMTERYRVLITMDTSCEQIILRDIHRTFPAHKFFRETGGIGQDGLYKVSKAYAVYDSEVGYCQGLSFIAASLLLHMPEEEAFSVLVSLMYNYGLRDLYKHGFESLYMRLYQLNRLMKDQLPRLYEHFERTGVETHMFASQWFLTLFTKRFPLYFVFHILDVFLLDGMPIIFQVALTLLSVCENELKQLDFEGILKYFIVSLPKKCRSTAQARKFMKSACERKVKKLKQYEEEYLNMKSLEDRKEIETKEIDIKVENMRRKMQTEITKLQEKLDQAVSQANTNERMNSTIILDYKQIIQRQEQQITKYNEMVEDMTKVFTSCDSCSTKIPPNSPLHKKLGNTNTTNLQMDAPLGPLDPLNVALQRVRELELELAQTKLAQVEAECRNQDLNHQLNSTLTEMNTNRSSWQPWISKTLNSIQEKVATRRDVPSFQSYIPAQESSGSTMAYGGAQQVRLRDQSGLTYKLPQRTSLQQRNSFDFAKTSDHQILKDSVSCNSLK